MAVTLTTEEWLARAIATHGDLYDYTQAKYTGAVKRVTIICRTHGPFAQIARSHSAGAGCPTCVAMRLPQRMPFALEHFVQNARAVHGERYTYECAEYVNALTPLMVTCSVHGPFPQRPADHVNHRKGCSRCADLIRNQSRTAKAAREFVQKAIALHGDRYDYSKTAYVRANLKVEIICPEHGPFSITPNGHLNARCCRRCKSSAGEIRLAAELRARGVSFETEWTHSTLRDKNPLRIDVAIPDARVLIEFDGTQHRRPVRWHKGMSNERATEIFKGIKRRDRIKEQWAKDNGWLLLRARNIAEIKTAAIRATEEVLLRQGAPGDGRREAGAVMNESSSRQRIGVS